MLLFHPLRHVLLYIYIYIYIHKYIYKYMYKKITKHACVFKILHQDSSRVHSSIILKINTAMCTCYLARQKHENSRYIGLKLKNAFPHHYYCACRYFIIFITVRSAVPPGYIFQSSENSDSIVTVLMST